MIKQGSRVRLIAITPQGRHAYYAIAEVISVSSRSITIKYVCKVNNDKNGKTEPEFKTESFLMTKVKSLQEWT